jgi:hypothetical protein
MKHLVLAVALISLTACSKGKLSGPVITETKKGSIAKSEMLDAKVKMPAGELFITGTPTDEVTAQFDYSSGGPGPNFKLDTTSFRARAVIDMPQDVESLSFEKNTWRVQIPEKVTTDLDVNIGAGEANLKLGTIDLRKVTLHMGAGKVVADFTGDPKRDYEIELRGGVGECDVTLPASAGIHADVKGGIGSIEVNGLTKVGDRYESPNYKDAKVKIHLSSHGGVGKIAISVR